MILKIVKKFVADEEISTFGLDVGSKVVKAVKIEKSLTGQYTVCNVGYEEIKADSPTREDVEAATVAAIESCVKSAAIHTGYSVCAVRGADVAVRAFEFPKIPIEEVKQAVVLEAEQVCPFDISQSIVDFNIISTDNSKIRGVLVAATADAITNKTKLVKKSAVKTAMMDTETLAVLNSFNYCMEDEKESVCGILSLGSEYVSLIIKDRKKPPFVRDLQTRCSDIVDWFIKTNSVDYAKAREDIFDNSKNADNIKFNSDLESACRNLINDISETIRFYGSNNGSKVDKLYLCGGFACSKAISELINKSLMCDVKVWDPFDKIKISKSFDLEQIREKGPSFALATGLAMRRI